MQRLPWHNDFPLDSARVATIVTDDLANELAVGNVAALGEGWDFTTFLVDGEWVFRFPKRRQSARQLAREHKLLTALAQALADQPIAIPSYRFFVAESKGFPLTYVGYRYLHGVPLAECDRDSIDRPAIGAQLGAFLARLERAAPSPRPRIYHDPFPSDWIDFRRELADARPSLPAPLAVACDRLFASAPKRDENPPLFQHCDLGAEHILVDPESHDIAAVIDWGDAGWGNPVADLVGLWAWGGDAAVRAAQPTWGRSLSPDDWVRLRMWGAAYAIGNAYYGYKDGRERLHATAIGWLDRMNDHGQLLDPATSDE
jgi:aminoglycoside phosphotransferase (APT) family kinase protein